MKDGVVTCPWHWWRYEIATGERLGAPELRERFRVEVRDGEVLVDVAPVQAEPTLRELLLRHARDWKAQQQR